MASGEFRDTDPFIVAKFRDVVDDIWSLSQFFFHDQDLEPFHTSVMAFPTGVILAHPPKDRPR